MAGTERRSPGNARRGAKPALVILAVLVAGCSSSAKGLRPSAAPATSAPGSATTGSPSSAPVTTGGGAGATAPTATSAATTNCPAASIVNGALGLQVTSPTRSIQPFGVTCTYSGSAIPLRIVFEEDTRATFAAGEQAVAGAGGAPTTVTGLGDAAYGVYGFLAVLKGSTALRITAPVASLAQLEGLARTILAA